MEKKFFKQSNSIPLLKSDSQHEEKDHLYLNSSILLTVKQLTNDHKKCMSGMLNISRSTLYYWVKTGKFPKPYKLSKKCSRWKYEEIKEYLDNLEK